jgi:hypothetical protein
MIDQPKIFSNNGGRFKPSGRSFLVRLGRSQIEPQLKEYGNAFYFKSQSGLAALDPDGLLCSDDIPVFGHPGR